MMTHKEIKRRPNVKKVPKNTLAVFHEEIGGFGGSDTHYTYYINNGIKWKEIPCFIGRPLSILYLITFQWHKRLLNEKVN